MTDDTSLPDGIRVRRRKLKDYHQSPNNHNRGTARGAEMLTSSFARHKAGRSLLVASDDGLIAGNQSQKAALAAGFDEVIEIETDGSVPVVVKRTDLTDVDGPEATALAYADNITQVISFDLDTAQVLADKERGVDLSGIWTPEELAAMTQPLIQHGASGDALPVGMEAAKLLQSKWQIAPGQLWVTDEGHRVLCGDCRNPEDMRRLFGEARAQIIVTSPPYAEQRSETYGGIPEAEYVAWWEAVQLNAAAFLVEGGSFFVNIKPHARNGERSLYVMDLVLAMRRQWGWLYVDEFCWRRHSPPGKWKDRFRNGFEPVHQFARPGQGKFQPERVGHWSEEVMVSTNVAGVAQSIGTGAYYNTSDETKPGLALPDNVITVQGTEAGVAHSAMFPIGLPEFFVKAYTDEGDIVFDPFLGGGTTLIAAHQQQRVGYGMEMLPEHVAVILERLTGHGLAPRLEE